MRKSSHNLGFRAAAVAVTAGLCVVISASAQVAPPSRDDNASSGGNSRSPRYVDSADYDRQPGYYVDGVKYKPYTPDKKKAKPAADTVKTAPTTQTPQTAAQPPEYVPTQDTGELHPFVPSSAAAQAKSADAASSRAAKTQAAASSSSDSAQSYVPKKRPRYAVAIIEALDKISSESVRFEAPIGQAVRYKGLIYTVKACETTADDEPMADVIAYMQVRTSPPPPANNAPPAKSKEIYRGWTYASTPSLNPLQHPIYDAWVIACRNPLPGAAGGQTP